VKGFLIDVRRVDGGRRAAAYDSRQQAINVAARTFINSPGVAEVKVLDPDGDVIWGRKSGSRFK
jgi:hypothetical protein